MARETQRAFLTSLEFTQTPQVNEDAWETEAPDFFPPITHVLESEADEVFDELTARAQLIEALKEAQHVGFDGDNTRDLATRLNATHIRDLPSMEAFRSFPSNATDVSLEALRDSIKETFKAILSALARFWAALMDQVQSWLELSKLVRVRIATAQGRLREVAGKQAYVDSVPGNLIPTLSTDRLTAKEARSVLINLQVLHRQLTLVRVNYLPMVNSITTVFMKEIERWGRTHFWNAGDDALGWLEALNYAAYDFRPARALGASRPYSNRQSSHWRSDTLMTECLPGYRWLVVVPPEPVDGSASVLRKAYALQTARVVMEEVQDRSRKTIESMDVFGQNDIEEILALTQKVVMEIEALTHSDTRRSLRDMTLRLDAVAKSNIDVPDGAVALFQAGVAYARTISRWAREPYQSLVLHALNVCNNSVRLCNLHTRAYKEAPKPKETPSNDPFGPSSPSSI